MIRFSHIAWAVFLVLAWVLFFWTGSAVLLACALALVIVPIGGLAAAAIAAQHVSLEFSGKTTAQKGMGAPCELEVRNDSVWPFVRCEVVLDATNLLTMQSQTIPLRLTLGPNSLTRAAFEISSAVCGRMLLTVRSVRLFEPFGLLFRTVKGIFPERRISIMPTLHALELSRLLAAAPLSDAVVYSQHTKGQDASEVFGLREYAEGDDLRQIHWKLSSKIEQLIVREASLPLDSSLLVFWDKAFINRVPSDMSVTDPVKNTLTADALAEVTLALCEAIAATGSEFDVSFNQLPGGQCFMQHVSDEADNYELISQAISHPMAESQESGLSDYLREFGRFACSRLIYIGAAYPRELDEISRRFSVLALICDGEHEQRQDGDVTCIRFDTDSVAAALQQVSVMR